jgi:hypothetical protein
MRYGNADCAGKVVSRYSHGKLGVSMKNKPRAWVVAASIVGILAAAAVAAAGYLEYGNDRLIYEVAKRDCVHGIASVTTKGPGGSFDCKLPG